MPRKSNLPRVLHLRSKHAEALNALALRTRNFLPIGLESRLVRLDHAAFSYALAMDPTGNAMYLQRIIHWLNHGAARFEDARDIRDLLSRFHVAKHRLPRDQRDIGHFESPGDLMEALEPLGPAELPDMPESISRDCAVAAHGEGWTILEVRTTQAAAFWGDSTNWCTRHPSTALGYLRQGSLHVLLSGKNKYQFHGPSEQLADRFDRLPHELPGVPDEAIQAAIEIIDGEPIPGASFVKVGIASHLRSILATRHGRSLTFPEYEAPQALSYGRQIWSSPDGRCSIGNRMTHPWDAQLPTIRIEIDRDETHDVRSDILTASRPYPEHIRNLMMDFIRSGAARISKGSMDDGVHHFHPEHKTELHLIAEHFLQQHHILPCVVVSEGHRHAIWFGKPRDEAPCLQILDIDGPSHERLSIVRDRRDFESAPKHLQAAIRLYNGSNPIPAMLVAMGAEATSNIAHWQDDDRAGDVVLAAFLARSSSGLASAIRLATGHLDEKTTNSVLRLVSSIEHRPISAFLHMNLNLEVQPQGVLVGRRTSRLPTVEDLRRAMQIKNAGLLIAGLPAAECTDDLIDEMISAGRGEVICAIPGDMLTPERIVEAYAKVEDMPRLVSPRVLTRHALDVVQELGPTIVPPHLNRYVMAMMHDKGVGLVRAMTSLINTDVPATEADTLRKVGLDGFYASPQAFPVLHGKVMEVFSAAPAHAMPWPYALARLRKDCSDLPTVVSESLQGCWGPPDARIDDLASALHMSRDKILAMAQTREPTFEASGGMISLR